MRVSIIIPLKKDMGYLDSCVESCLEQAGAFDEIELIILPDAPIPKYMGEDVDRRIIVVPTGPATPAQKRNKGVEVSSGEVLAFIDDDTRPLKGWLEAAMHHLLTDADVGAVGGPSVTPKTDTHTARVSGAVYASWFMSGREVRRYVPDYRSRVDDWPSCNLVVRRDAFDAVGGFSTNFWPGEDTIFCLNLFKKGFMIQYEPDAVIEHFRRRTWREHFMQLGNYGLHRGYFVKRYPETSMRLPYFLPSIALLVGTLLLLLSLLGFLWAMKTLGVLVLLYVILSMISLWSNPWNLFFPAIPMLAWSHVVYGFRFLEGLFSMKLPEEK